MIKAIIVDDEKPAREVIKNYLAEYCPDVEIIAMADSARTALQSIHLHHPELVFLDVEMPNGSGFDLLRALKHIDFHIIFVTAYSQFALDAFRFSATDYLLKPINITELVDAVGKVRKELIIKRETSNIETLLEFLKSSDKKLDKLVIPETSGFKVVSVSSIIYCEADAYCTHFFTINNVKLTSSKNLKFYEEMLEERDFLRVHNSYLINLSHVKEYSSEGFIILTDNYRAPVGNTYKRRFLERFGRR